MDNSKIQTPTEADADEVSEKIIPNLTEWAKEAGIDQEAMKAEIIAYMTTIGAIAIDSEANVDKVQAVAFHSTVGKHEYMLVVQRKLHKTPKGKPIIARI